MHINGKKDILILGNRPTQELDNTILTAKGECSINFFQNHKENFVKSLLQCRQQFFIRECQTFMLIQSKNLIYIKQYPMYLQNISKDFAAN